MEEEDERTKHLCGEAREVIHATWKVNGLQDE